MTLHSVASEYRISLVVASLWYLALTSLLSLGQWRLERRLNRSQRGSR